MNDWVICCTKEGFHKNAAIFKIMANPTRLEILNRLRVRDHTVGELKGILVLRKANISQHLSILRHNNLVKAKRKGQSISYSLSEPRLVDACKILKEVSEELVVV